MSISTVQKIAVLSDIHGNIAALEAVVNDMNQKGVDQVINLGDHISGPLWPKETIEFLMRQNWIHISGNHDKNLVTKKPGEQNPSDKYAIQFINDDEKTWLESLPESIELYEMLLFHGIPSDNNTYLLETVENGRTKLSTQSEIIGRLGKEIPKVILCGHSHIQRVVEIPGSIIINPGSVGLQAYDDDKPEYHIIEMRSPHARYSIIEYQNKIQTIETIAVSYDCQSAVKQALRNNRLDWAIGLQSGCMSN